jgi:hypothetical protein
MDPTAIEVLERLVDAHPDKPLPAIIRTLTRCLDELPDGDLLAVEQEVRARLSEG